MIPAIAALSAQLFIRGTSAPAHAAPSPQFTEASCADMPIAALLVMLAGVASATAGVQWWVRK
jgi:hypothetical protein